MTRRSLTDRTAKPLVFVGAALFAARIVNIGPAETGPAVRLDPVPRLTRILPAGRWTACDGRRPRRRVAVGSGAGHEG